MDGATNEQGITYDYPSDPARQLPIFDMTDGAAQFYVDAKEGYTWAWRDRGTDFLGVLGVIPWGYYGVIGYHKRCIFQGGQLAIEWPDLSEAAYRSLNGSAPGPSAPGEVVPLAGHDYIAGKSWWDWVVVEPEPDPVKRRSPLRECGRTNRYADAKAAAEQLSRERDALIMVVRTVWTGSAY